LRQDGPWSCVTRYRGVVAPFAVGRGRAAAWFLLLPLAVCLLSGVGGAAYGVLTSSQD
jgi:hypothetical protein